MENLYISLSESNNSAIFKLIMSIVDNTIEINEYIIYEQNGFIIMLESINYNKDLLTNEKFYSDVKNGLGLLVGDVEDDINVLCAVILDLIEK